MQEWHSFSKFGPTSCRFEIELHLLQGELGPTLNRSVDGLACRWIRCEAGHIDLGLMPVDD